MQTQPFYLTSLDKSNVPPSNNCFVLITTMQRAIGASILDPFVYDEAIFNDVN